MTRVMVNADCKTCGHHFLRHGNSRDGGKCNGCLNIRCEKYVFPE